MNYTVTNGNDEGLGSLRNAITDANSNPGSTIIIDADVENIYITGSEMQITSSMTIIYDGSDKVAVTRINDSIGRIFFIAASGDTVSMKKLVIEGGISPENGGAIIVTSASALNMTDCIMQNNSTYSAPDQYSDGGCICIIEGSYINMVNCIMQNNSTTSEWTWGGCIIIANGSHMIMKDCIMQNNSAAGEQSDGGCIHMGDATVIMDNCLIQNNFATGEASFAFVEGGATLEMTNCRIINNTAFLSEGAISNYGSIILKSCTIDGNNADGSGAISGRGNVNIKNCTISNNKTDHPGAGLAIWGFLSDTQITIVNSTFYNNNSLTYNGGAIYIESFTDIYVKIINCTISNNIAADGGGIYKETDGGTLVLQNTIVAGNFGIHPDIFGSVSSPIDSPSGYNLIGDGNGSNMNDGVDGNIVGDSDTPADPKLNPLGDYGGPTQTMTLKLDESPATNKGNTSYVPDDVHFDQRGPGYPRIQDGNVNIGATEGTILCYSGESLVLTKNVSDNKIGITKAKDVTPDKHLIFDVTNNDFVPVRLNVITGPTNRYMLIKKDSLGRNKPSSDFYVTSGHRLVIDGVEIKARDVPRAKRIKVNNEKVYTICLDKRSVIRVNNLDIIAFSYDEWINRSKKKSI